MKIKGKRTGVKYAVFKKALKTLCEGNKVFIATPSPGVKDSIITTFKELGLLVDAVEIYHQDAHQYNYGKDGEILGITTGKALFSGFSVKAKSINE